jgi:ribose transport system substrate-binding protein
MTTPGTPTIAVFTKNHTNPAYAAARLGAERTAARLGARVTHYVPRQPDHLEEQIALVEQALADRTHAIVFAPVHATRMDDSVRRINAAGIPLVNFINRLAAGEVVTYVGSDDVRLARAIALRLIDHLGGKGDLVVLEGVPGAVSSQDRMRGFQDAVRASPRARIVAARPADYQRETARRVTRELLAAVPRIDGILSANDVMSLGAIDALREAGRSIPLIGVNALPEAVAELKSGRLLATVDFDAMKISCVATEAALRHLRGKPVPRDIELPVQIVDAGNCAPWDRPLEERECPRWEDVVV